MASLMSLHPRHEHCCHAPGQRRKQLKKCQKLTDWFQHCQLSIISSCVRVANRCAPGQRNPPPQEVESGQVAPGQIFRALAGRLKFTVRRHKFEKDSLFYLSTFLG